MRSPSFQSSSGLPVQHSTTQHNTTRASAVLATPTADKRPTELREHPARGAVMARQRTVQLHSPEKREWISAATRRDERTQAHSLFASVGALQSVRLRHLPQSARRVLAENARHRSVALRERAEEADRPPASLGLQSKGDAVLLLRAHHELPVSEQHAAGQAAVAHRLLLLLCVAFGLFPIAARLQRAFRCKTTRTS